jgi:Carboxypeptidase regulatory-like domain/TonB dependent receptor-like, beta-barrel/TonB-dependent Receptor Plug Domain
MSMTSRLPTRGLAALFAASLLAAAPVRAQNSTTTGAIRGLITGPGDAPLENATITGRNINTGFERSARTNNDGQYALVLLPPGTYTVQARLIGFLADSQPNITVSVGQTATVNFAMVQQAVALQGVQVQAAARPAIDVTDASVSQSVSQKEIETLPSLGRDFTDFINLSGLVDPNPERTTGGQFSIAGLRPSQTNVQIDGVDANNSFFGENRGGSRIPFEFSLESIREFQIITNGFDVEYGNYTGGVVNVVTRGGTNAFEGTAYANYSGDQFAARDFLGKPAIDFSSMQYAARYSGPIKRDKAFFLFSLDGQRRREPQLPLRPAYFLDKLDASGNPAPDTAGANHLQQFIDILQSTYGVTDAASKYSDFQTTNDVITLFGRIDWNLNRNHRFSLRENFANHHNDNLFSPGFDFSYGQARAENLGDRSSSLVGELQSVTGPHTFNVLRFQFSDEDRPRNGHDLRPSLFVTNIGGGQSAGFGGTFVSLDNDLLERKLQVIDNFTLEVGQHTFKVGGSAIHSHLKNSFIGPTGSIDNTTGAYTFATLSDFAAMKPSSYTRSETIDGTVPLSKFNVGEYSVYAQDEWRPTRKLTATLGVRYDVESFLNNPQRVINAERAFGVKSGNAPTDKNNVSPRLALAYDVNGDGRSVARLGMGYFYGRLPYVVGGNVTSSVNPVLSLTCAGSSATGAPDAPPPVSGFSSWSTGGTNDPVTCAGGQTGTGVPTYTFWKDHFQYPESFKANIGYDRLIAGDTKLSADIVWSRSYRLYTVRNLNLRPAQFTLADEGNRQIFVPAAVFNPSSATSTSLNAALNTDFAQIYANYNDGQAQSLAGTMELTRTFRGGSQARVSYTYTRAYDNSSYTCCTAKEGFTNPAVGEFGPNDIGGVGATDKAWGPSATVRNHVIVISGNAQLPWDIRVSGLWRFQSGNHWGPEQGGDLNGDGVNFNDRPFIFAPADLPLTETDPAKAQAIRDRYAGYLDGYPCVKKYVGRIIPRNPCILPWFNRMDIQLAKSITTTSSQRAELQVNLFNVLNGLNRKWGRYMGVFGANRDLLTPNSFDAATGKILYSVPTTFGSLGITGANLLLQFQAQVGLKYYF